MIIDAGWTIVRVLQMV